MTYDTTLVETLEHKSEREALPACLTRDNLSPEYFPACTRSQLALVVTLCLVFGWICFHKLNHTDLWGHLNFGRWMATHGALPAMDPFAAEPGEQAIVHSAWLSQLLGYETIATLGLEGLVLGHALLATLGVGILIAAIRQRGVPLAWAIAGGVAYYLLSLPIVGTIRPQLFGMVGAPLVLLACSYLPEKRHPLIWLPITFALWANLHGSFVMGLVMLGVCCVGVTWRIFGETGGLKPTAFDVRCVRMWAALGLSVVASSFNPQGPALLTNVLSFGHHSALADISEWRALSVASLSGGLFYTSLAVLLVMFKISPKRWEMRDLLLAIVFGLATITAMRMLAWWAVIWPWVFVPYLAAYWQARFGTNETPAPATTMRTLQATGFVFMTILISPATNNLLLNQPRGIGTIGGSDTPIYVADEIARRKLSGAFFAPMDWSDYLVWEQPAGFRPLAYSHVHLLGDDIWQDHQQIAGGSGEWLALADKHKLKYLVISMDRNKQLAQQVSRYSRQPKSRATVLYQDRKAVLVQLKSQVTPTASVSEASQ